MTQAVLKYGDYRTLGEAWLHTVQDCLQGRCCQIERGSFVGHIRFQLDFLAFRITNPYERPLGIQYHGQPISDDRSIETYFIDYLLSEQRAVNEEYTYGERIAPYLSMVADILTNTPNTNQATIEIARPEDLLLADPPCLRVLSWKVTPVGLQLTSFWRSWDVYAALPTNLGGLIRLNETMAEWAGLPVGPLVCYSDGAHVYDYCKKMMENDYALR